MRRLPTVRRPFAASATLALTAWLWLSAALPLPADSAEPGRPARRYIPAKGLIAYLEYDGLDAHAEAWRATAAHDLLVKTSAGSMVLGLVKQLTGVYLENDFGGLLTVPEAMTIAEVMVRRGFACGICQDETAYHGMLVVNDIGRAEHLKRFGRLRDVFNATPSVVFAEIERSQFRGRTIYAPEGDEPFSAWFEGDDLIVVLDLDSANNQDANARQKQRAETHRTHMGKMLDCADGRRPDAGRHPSFLSARAEGKDLKGFEANGLWFVDSTGDLGATVLAEGAGLAAEFILSALAVPAGQARPEKKAEAAPAEADDAVAAAPTANDEITRARRALGLDGIKRVVGRWGFQGKALLSDIRIEAPAPRRALAAVLDLPTFRTDRLPPIPAGAGMFVVGSVDLDTDYRTLTEAAKALDAASADQIAAIEQGWRDACGLRLREDVLRLIGPTWCVYELPPGAEGPARHDPAGPWDHVLVAGINDPDQIAKDVAALAAFCGQLDGFWEVFFADAGAKRGEAAGMPRIEPLPAPDRGYRLILPPGPGAGARRPRQPTLLIGASTAVIAGDLETARRALSIDPGAADLREPSGELARALDGLPRELTFLAVTGTADLRLPERLGHLPGVVQTLVNLSWPHESGDETILSLCDALGVARPGAPCIRVDRSKVPGPDWIRRTLLPSVVATTVDGRGFRIIGREALPFLGIANELKLGPRWTVSWHRWRPSVRMGLALTLPRFGWEP
jgi:hypothetical protein